MSRGKPRRPRIRAPPTRGRRPREEVSVILGSILIFPCYTYFMKLKSYLFISFLIVVLFFILGVRYGQRVEKNNKVIDYLLSITPSPSPPPSPTISYKEYKSKRWGLKFTFPAGLEIKESTNTPEILFEAH